MKNEFSLDDVVIAQALPRTELIRSIELQISSATVEVGFAFDSAGAVVVRSLGSASSIRFSQPEIEAMHGHTLTHNHPNRGFFSIFDIHFAALADLKAIRAVAGKKVYILTRPMSGWNRKEFDAKFENEKRKILRNLEQRQINRTEASKRANNLIQTVVKLVALPLREENL